MISELNYQVSLGLLFNEYSEVMAMDGLKIMVRASSNSPSVLSGILLSSQPEQVQDLMLYLALLHPGRQFHSSTRNLRLHTIIVAFWRDIFSVPLPAVSG